MTGGTLTFSLSTSVTFRADADGNGVGAFSMNPTDTIVAPGIPVTISGANLIVGNIRTTSGRFSRAGNITLTAPGNISTGTIDASNLTGLGYEAGNVAITSSSGSIATGPISTQSDRTTGSVSLSAASSNGNVTFSSIDARGTGLSGARGGTVTITAGQFVRGTGFINGPSSPTIDSSGIGASGPITIRHNGGARQTPFVVGDAATNGTAGAITSGTTGAPNTLAPTQSFPGSFTQADIQILTSSPPSQVPPSQFPLPVPLPIPVDENSPFPIQNSRKALQPI